MGDFNMQNTYLMAKMKMVQKIGDKMAPETQRKRRKNHNIRPAQGKSPKRDVSTLRYCLENFTAMELMTDGEKVACSQCTEKNGKGSLVLTTSTKQMLIQSAPAVLILHLKRFEIKAGSGSSRKNPTKLRKLNGHIQFPMELDLAPYICYENQAMNLISSQKETLYSLYAVIEHRGTLNEGHYIVYVKSKAAKTDESHLKDVNENECEQGGRMSLPAKWFSVSDDLVREMDEMEVLKSEAYILFYEKCS